MQYISLPKILALHQEIIDTFGGLPGLRDMGVLESSILQPRATFDKKDLYPDIVSKAASLCFSIIKNHPFNDGNKRVSHAAMEAFLMLNNFEIRATVDDQEKIILSLASGKITQEDFANWLKNHMTKLSL